MRPQQAATTGTSAAAPAYFPIVDDGVYLMVRPLATGQHTIAFHGEFPDFKFAFDVTYDIVVVP